jgi:hypothetical protein
MRHETRGVPKIRHAKNEERAKRGMQINSNSAKNY